MQSAKPLTSRQKRHRKLGFATAIIWGLFLSIYVGRTSLSAKKPMIVELVTAPKSVIIKVDRKPWEDGQYVETPQKLLLDPGTHKIKLERQGYINHELTVIGLAGQSIPIEHVLEKDPDLKFVDLEVVTHGGGDEIFVTINDTFVRGDTPISTMDLEINKEHTLTAFPQWPSRKKSMSCILKSDGSEPLYVKLKRSKSGRVITKDCRRIRRKN